MPELLETARIKLRALEPEDVELLYRWENDPEIWGVSDTLLPFSRQTLRRFIEEQAYDIYRTRQTRFIVETAGEPSRRPVGAIDLFDFDPYHLRAGVGILIYGREDRGKGYAADAVELLAEYGFRVLGLHQLHCNIPADNAASIALFEKCGFRLCGTKREWLRTETGWRDELIYQRLRDQ